MAQITAAMVKELREMTGAGMMECKKALTEAEGSIEAAVDVLRTRGLAAVAKKAGRATNEGYVMALTSDDGKTGVVVELKCETDFVSTNEKFRGYVERIAKAALAAKPADVEALKAVAAEGIDPTCDQFKACGRDVAMQVAAMSPIAANRDAVPAETVEHELAIYKAQAAESGKPEAIQEKMATGRLEKFYKEQCLTEQAFVKDGDKTVGSYVDGVAKELGGSLKVVGFVHFALGE